MPGILTSPKSAFVNCRVIAISSTADKVGFSASSSCGPRGRTCRNARLNLAISCFHIMLLPELTERLSRMLKTDRASLLTDEVQEIEPRPLSEVEGGWISSMLDVSAGWETADISKTQVIAEGPRTEGISFTLQTPSPENPKAKAVRNSFGNLWIETSNQLVINAQLSELEGSLQQR